MTKLLRIEFLLKFIELFKFENLNTGKIFYSLPSYHLRFYFILFFVKIYQPRDIENARFQVTVTGDDIDECSSVLSFRISVRDRKFWSAGRNLITLVSRSLSASKMFPLSSLYDRLDRIVILLSRAAMVRSVEKLVRSIGGVARECSIIMILFIEYLPRLAAKWRNSENGPRINQPAAELPDPISWSRVQSVPAGRDGIGNWNKLRGLIVRDELIRADFTAM